jgi:hypothetical protein
MIDNDNNHDKHEDEMMIPFFSIASRDFDQDLSKEHILKMHTNSVREPHWPQDGGFLRSSLNLTLSKRFFS